MKYKPPHSVTIFYDYFLQAGGGNGPSHPPPLSATEEINSVWLANFLAVKWR